jgi:CRP-like cAMP-binding protein
MESQKEQAIIKLDPKITRKIEQHGDSLLCQSDMVLFYEGHIPIVVYLLKSGSIEIGQGRKKRFELNSGEILGMNQLYQKCPSLFWAEAKKGSELIYIDKSTLNELVSNGPKMIQKVLSMALTN